MEPSASSQMLRGSRPHPVNSTTSFVIRIYTYRNCKWIRDRLVIWVVVVHWRDRVTAQNYGNLVILLSEIKKRL